MKRAIGLCFMIVLFLQADVKSLLSDDFPANPLEKPGWKLVVHDEFSGPELNSTLWISEYFPGRFYKKYRARYYFENGAIHLHVNGKDVEPFQSYQGVSSLQSYNCFNLHKTYASEPFNVQTENRFSSLYGWYEIRAKYRGPVHHVAFWMLEARENGSEIDVFEGPAWPGPHWHKWKWNGPFPKKCKRVQTYNDISTAKQRSTGFHIYALELYPNGARVYHDNQLIEQVQINWKERGEIPFMFFLSLYGSKNVEDKEKIQEYIIDYFRAYRKNQCRDNNWSRGN